MPMPIKMVKDRDSLDGLFNYTTEDESSAARSLSELQQAFLSATDAGGRSASRKPKLSLATVELLERIHKEQDEIVTAASEAAGVRGDTEVFRVPASISEYDLTALKAQGLITGRSRVVAFTETAKVALRDHWLKQPSILAQNRTKTRFVHPAAPDFVPTRKSSVVAQGEPRLRRFATKTETV